MGGFVWTKRYGKAGLFIRRYGRFTMRRREVMATITTFMYEKESTGSKIVRKDKDTQGYVKRIDGLVICLLFMTE